MAKQLCPVDKRLMEGIRSSNIIIAQVEDRNSYIIYDMAVLVESNGAVHVSGENANGGPRMEQGGRHKINRTSLENVRHLILCLRAQLARQHQDPHRFHLVRRKKGQLAMMTPADP